MYWLDILNGPSRSRRPVHRRSLVAGSDLSCPLWLDAAHIAPRHAEFVDDNGVVIVRPIPPARITVNGQEVTGPHVLSDGDTLGIGEIRIRYRALIPWWSRYRTALALGSIGLAAGLTGALWIASRLRGTDETVAAGHTSPESEATPALPATPAGIQTPSVALVPPSEAHAVGTVDSEPVTTTSTVTVVRSPPARESWVGQLVEVVSTATLSAATQTEQRTANLWVPLPSEPARAPSPPVSTIEETGWISTAAGRIETNPISLSEFEEELDEAERALSSDRWLEASNRAARVPPSDIGYARACHILARVAEARGDLTEAERWWTRVLSATNRGPLYDQAVEALVRIAQASLERAPPPLLDLAARTWTAEQAAVKSSLEQPPPLRAETMQALTAQLATARSTQTTPQLFAPPLATSTRLPVAAQGPAAGPHISPLPSALSTSHSAATLPDGKTLPGQESSPKVPPAAKAPERPPSGALATATVARVPPQKHISPPPAVVPRMRIEQISVTRFPDDARWDELRLVEIVLRLDEQTSLDPSSVELETIFFDRNETATQVFPSRAAQGGGRIRLSGAPWRAGETRRVTMYYTVPAGSRARDRARLGFHTVFHGLRVRVYVNGQLTDEAARPTDLLRVIPTSTSSADLSHR